MSGVRTSWRTWTWYASSIYQHISDPPVSSNPMTDHYFTLSHGLHQVTVNTVLTFTCKILFSIFFHMQPPRTECGIWCNSHYHHHHLGFHSWISHSITNVVSGKTAFNWEHKHSYFKDEMTLCCWDWLWFALEVYGWIVSSASSPLAKHWNLIYLNFFLRYKQHIALRCWQTGSMYKIWSD